MFGEAEPQAPLIDIERPENNIFLRYALDLFNFGYFWESHVYFEALWNAHGRQGSVADLMKAFIKLGAAMIKLNLKQQQSAIGHFNRAQELLSALTQQEGSPFLGFNLSELSGSTAALASGDEMTMQVHPQWD